VQVLAGRGLVAVAVAPRSAPFPELKSDWPVLHNPAYRDRAVPLIYKQFPYAFANAVEDAEARNLY